MNPRNPAFKCYTPYYTDLHSCPNVTVSQSKIEAVVLSSLKSLTAALIDREELRRDALSRERETKTELESMMQAENRAVRLMEESVTKNFTLLVSGTLTKEAFVSKKETINLAIARKNAELERLRERLRDVTDGKGAIEGRLAELRTLLDVETLDKGLVDLTVDKILVHGENEIEIVWAGAFGNGQES
jgi:hypothetical protein